MSVMHARVGDVDGLGRAERRAVGDGEGRLARAAALGVGRGADVRRAPRLHEVLEPDAARAVGEERHRLAAVPPRDVLEPARRPRSAPRPRRPPRTRRSPRFARRTSGLLQPVGVVELPGRAGAARAEHAAGERVLGVAGDLRDPAVLHVGEHAAAPEAELAVGRDDAVAVGARVGDRVAVEPPPARREARTRAATPPAPAAPIWMNFLRVIAIVPSVARPPQGSALALLHAADEVAQRRLGEPVAREPVLARRVDEPAAPQDAQLLRHDRLRDVRAARRGAFTCASPRAEQSRRCAAAAGAPPPSAPRPRARPAP